MDEPNHEKYLREMAEQIGKPTNNISEKCLTGFSALQGATYANELMWVGRAVNGWTKGWRPEDFRDEAAIEEFVHAVMTATDGGTAEKPLCKLRDVTEMWSYKEGETYRFSRSAFWRTAKQILLKLKIPDIDINAWPSNLVWSNLYKIAPHEGGNPGEKLAQIQEQACKELLIEEIRAYRPKRLVFATGEGWIKPFLDDKHLPSTKASDNFKYVSRTGEIIIDGERIGRFVVADHPRGKMESIWVEEVMANLD